MMNTSKVNQVKVHLTNNDQGQECVSLNISGEGEGLALCLSPSQARALATDLVTAVNRVEVKANLKFSPNMWRRPGEQTTRLATGT